MPGSSPGSGLNARRTGACSPPRPTGSPRPPRTCAPPMAGTTCTRCRCSRSPARGSAATWCSPTPACSLRSAWLPGWTLLARTGRPVPGEELAWLAVLGGLLGHRSRPESGPAEQPEPGVPAEQAQPVRFVHHADLSARFPEQERVLGEGPGVARVRVVGPVQVPRRPPVRAVDAAVAGARLEVLGDVVGHEHRDA